MNSEENHGFTSFDFITMLVSFIVIVVVTAPIIRKNIQTDQGGDKARIEAATIGRALLDPKNLQNMISDNQYVQKGDRSVASIAKNESIPKLDLDSVKAGLKDGQFQGKVSTKDPWGNKYNYVFLRNTKGIVTHIAVWSDGSNSANHDGGTSAQRLFTGPDSAGRFQFKDDNQVGSILPIR